MDLHQLNKKLQARRDGRPVYCKKNKQKGKQTANMSGTAAHMPVQVKTIFTVLQRLPKRNRLRYITTVVTMSVFSVLFKNKKI
jgi:hypothetical protein